MDGTLQQAASPRQELKEEAILEKFGSVPGISISIHEEVPNTISLHYSPPENDDPNGIKWELFNEAISRVESLLKHFPAIKRIYATTWIAHENPKFFEMYGFTVTQPQKNSEGGFFFSEEPYRTLHHIYVKNKREFNIRPEHIHIPPAVAEFSSEDFVKKDAKWRKWVGRGTRRLQGRGRTSATE